MKSMSNFINKQLIRKKLKMNEVMRLCGVLYNLLLLRLFCLELGINEVLIRGK